MPFGFGKRGRESVPSDGGDDYYGDDDGYNNNDYHAPPADAFQHNHSHTAAGGGDGEFQDEYVEEDYGFANGSQEGQFAGVTTTTAQLSEEQRRQLAESKVGLSAAERLAMINDTANINSHQASLQLKRRQSLCSRCYLLIILAMIGLVLGLYFAFGGPGSGTATNTFREAWRPPSPTPRPTRAPTIRPSAAPSARASDNPSARPTAKPTVVVSESPTSMPASGPPSPLPSTTETDSPSLVPSSSEPTTMEPTTVAPTAAVAPVATDASDETAPPEVGNNQTDSITSGGGSNTGNNSTVTDVTNIFDDDGSTTDQVADNSTDTAGGGSQGAGNSTDTSTDESQGANVSVDNGLATEQVADNSTDTATDESQGTNVSVDNGLATEQVTDNSTDTATDESQGANVTGGESGSSSGGGDAGESGTHQQEGHGDGDGVLGDNIFKETPPIAEIDCGDGTEVVTVYMADAVGDGWEGAELSVAEDGGTGSSVQPIFIDALGTNEKARGVGVCLEVGTCYRVVVDGGMFMEEIRWGIGHIKVTTEEDVTLFVTRDAELIESKAMWLAPADCSFSLYGACSNSCKSGYGENPPALDESGNIIEKGGTSPAAGQGNSGGGQTQSGASTSQNGNDSGTEAGEPVQEQIVSGTLAPTSSPPVTDAPVSPSPVSALPTNAPIDLTVAEPVVAAGSSSPVPTSGPLPTLQPVTSPPSAAPISPAKFSNPPTLSPVDPPTQPMMPGKMYSAGDTNNPDDAFVGEPLSWSYSYSYSYSYSSYERKLRRGRERKVRRARHLAHQSRR